MIRILAGWFAMGIGLTGLWVGAITLLSGLSCLRRWTQPPDPEADLPRSQLIIFSASSNATAERECLRALEELWEASQ